MTTMAMAPALPRTTGRATARATALPTVHGRPAVTLRPRPDATTRAVATAAGDVVTSVTATTAPARGFAGLHLTVRGRVVLWMVALVMIAAAVLVASRAAADGPVSAQQVERHGVQPGETMWQIATDIAEPGQDVRDVVFDLVRLNELPDAGLMAGQVIVVPVD